MVKSADEHPEADVMDKAIANFYRFWISYALGSTSSKQDLQHLVASLNEYNQARATAPGLLDTWNSEEPRGA